MTDFYPQISVLFITYKRIDLLKKTYDSFLANTDYPREKLELILCDDGSPEEIKNEMRKLKFDKYLLAKKNEGMAKNVNKGIRAASGEYILQIQDDWFCKGPGDYLNLGIRALNEIPEIGLIRYRLGTDYLHSTRLFNNGINSFQIINKDQKDQRKEVNHRKATFLYSDTPHLKRRQLHEKVGLFKPYKNMAKTEINFCVRFNDYGFFDAGYVEDYGEVFEHIGESQSFRKLSALSKIKAKIKSALNF